MPEVRTTGNSYIDSAHGFGLVVVVRVRADVHHVDFAICQCRGLCIEVDDAKYYRTEFRFISPPLFIRYKGVGFRRRVVTLKLEWAAGRQEAALPARIENVRILGC